jgi:hypothetical protein
MQRPIFARMPIVSVATPTLPPMYDWPTPVKYAVMSACTMVCIVAYMVMGWGFMGLATLVLGFL